MGQSAAAELFRLDIHALLRRPAHIEAQGLAQVPELVGNRQRSRRIDMYEIIVLERSGTFQHYFVRGVLQ